MPAADSSSPTHGHDKLIGDLFLPAAGRPLKRQRIRPRADFWAVAAGFQHWITLQTSMTREIEMVLGARPDVRLLHEGPDRMSVWEADALGLPRRGRAYAREIALLVDGRPVMLARSLSPPDDPVAALLRRLRRAPLADLLFRDPRWCRAAPPRPLRWNSAGGAITGRACLWQRSRLGGKVLVEEFFLPALTAVGPSPAAQ